ncbi:MAG TPA: hypothetical protein VGD43_08955 [Micromonospora sp.]
MTRSIRRLTIAGLLAGALILSAGCSRPAPTPSATSSAPTALPGTASPGTPADPSVTSQAGGSSGASTGPSRWGNSPVTVVHRPAVPPVPVLTGIRSAAHPAEGYDRVVFDFRGALPGYTVRYVTEVRADPSDERVDVPGRRYLLVTFHPAQAHTDDGATTVPARAAFDSTLRGYALAGDFEGTVTVALGLDRVAGFQVGELPGRIYLDVAR